MKLTDKLSKQTKMILFVVFIAALGLLAFFSSPILCIWFGCKLALKVGLTGLFTSIGTIAYWWFLFNLIINTKEAINGKEKN